MCGVVVGGVAVRGVDGGLTIGRVVSAPAGDQFCCGCCLVMVSTRLFVSFHVGVLSASICLHINASHGMKWA